MEQTYSIEIIQPSDLENLSTQDNVIELTDVGIIGLDSLCRLCANRSDHLIPIYDGEGLDYQLEAKINRHFPFSVERTDTLPTHCCYQCASTLLTWHELIETSIEADRRLKALEFDTVVQFNHKLENLEEPAAPEEVIPDETTEIYEEAQETENISDVSTNDQQRHEKKVINNTIKSTDDVKNIRIQTCQPETIQNDLKIKKEFLSKTYKLYEIKTNTGIPTNNERIPTKIIYLCSKCQLTFSTIEKFTQHSKSHYHCSICSCYFENELKWFEHNANHEQIVPCDYCEQKFIHETHLQYHKIEFHQQFECNLCKIRFQNEQQLKYHILNHNTNLKCEICFRQFTRVGNLNAHLLTHITDIYCKVCCSSFITQFRLENHLSIHTETEIAESEINPKFIQCSFNETCFEKFPSRLQLYEHKKQFHLKIHEYPCTKCARKFKTESQLRTHTKNNHQSNTMCLICNKRFSTEKILREHLRLHTGEKPFKCNICNVRFRCQSSLVGHRMVHSHERRYMCGICKRTFARACYLKGHLRTHRQERPFQCPFCDKRFTQSNVLKSHISVRHQNCSICHKNIGSKILMRVHLLKEHNIKNDEASNVGSTVSNYV